MVLEKPPILTKTIDLMRDWDTAVMTAARVGDDTAVDTGGAPPQLTLKKMPYFMTV